RRDDVRRVLARELEDVFAEVGLDHPQAVALERLVEPDLLARHRLRLGDEPCLAAAADLPDRIGCLPRGRGEMDVAAAGLDRVREILEVAVELRDRLLPDLAPARPQPFDVREQAPGREARIAEARGRGVEGLLRVSI